MRPGALLKFILIATVLFWGGVACFIYFENRPQKRALDVAKTALMATVDNPESVQIKGISKVDSVFGKEYVNRNEQMALSVTLMKLGQEMMKEDCLENIGTDLEHWEIPQQVKQRMEAMTALRELVGMGMLESNVMLTADLAVIFFKYHSPSSSRMSSNGLLMLLLNVSAM